MSLNPYRRPWKHKLNQTTIFLLCCLVVVFQLTIAEDEVTAGHLKIKRRCRTSIVYVKDMYLTCSSPKAYYNYENDQSSYQQSARCKYGDRGKLSVHFSISEGDHGWYGVDIQLDTGYMNSYKTVQSSTDVCSLGTLSVDSDDDSVSSNTQCPGPGDYVLHWTFTIPSFGDDDQFQFLPDVRAKFFNHPDQNDDDGSTRVFTIGCAGSGTTETVHESKKRQQVGQWALGIALTVFFAIFGLCLLMVYRRQEHLEKELKGRELHRYYYYARNSATGELVPIGTNREEQAKHHHESYHEKSQKQILQVAVSGSMDDEDSPPLHTPWR